MLPLSHDEVVHGKGSLLGKMAGDDWQKFANLRAYYAFMWGYPGKKLLFMGQEFAQRDEWSEERGARLAPARLRARIGACGGWSRDLNRALPRACRRCMRATASREGFEWLIVDDHANSVFAWLRKAPGEQPGRGHLQLHAGAARQLPRAAAAGRATGARCINTDAGDYGGSRQGQSGRGRRASRARADGRLGDDAACRRWRR